MDVRPDAAVTNPAVERAAPAASWRDALYSRLRGQPLPLLWTREDLVAAASLWAGARRWTAWWRAQGVGPGDRVVCAMPPGPGFVMLLVAALWDDLTFVPAPAGAEVESLLESIDARYAVVAPGRPAGAAIVVASRAGTPPDAAVISRPARAGPTRDARFLLETSGTTAAPRRVALSDANVRAVLASHVPLLAMEGAVVLSVLPWHHAFGLVLELLPALLSGAELLRDPSGGRDAAAMLAVAAEHPVTHVHAVPHTVRLLAERDEGRALLGRLRAGVIGGAPIDSTLAGLLRGTRLRVGYGQTEASPGIAMGDPGAWHAGALGRPVGCAVRLEADGMLAFRGENACLGVWEADATGGLGISVEPPGRWVRTGDLARREPDGTYTFEGRVADSFKLENGRFVPAASVERAVRARWPQLVEALLSSPDGRSLVLALSTVRDAEALPEPDDLPELLGPLAVRPLRIVRVPRDAWVRTGKGELDRRFPTGRDRVGDDGP